MQNEDQTSPNEIHPEFVGIHALNSFLPQVSASRAQMFFMHFAQRPPLINPESKRIKSGTEVEMTDTIDEAKTTEDCVVRAIIQGPSYQETLDQNLRPDTLVIVEYQHETPSGAVFYLDVIDMPGYKSHHTKFGYPLNPTEAFDDMQKDLGGKRNTVYPKDTVVGQAKSHMDDNSYAYGVHANVLYATLPQTSEDGIVISESFAKRTSISVLETRIIDIKAKTLPLNIFGDQTHFKCLPDIGQEVGPSGLLFASRKKDPYFLPVDIADRFVSEVNYSFDECVHVKPKSRVVGIRVIRGNAKERNLPSKVTEQIDKYASETTNYYRRLVSQVNTVWRQRAGTFSDPSRLRLSPALHRVMKHAETIVAAHSERKAKPRLMYKRKPIEDYRIEVTTLCEYAATRGSKITDIHGGKGTITLDPVPDHLMPRDEKGNIADIIIDPYSTSARMNPGRTVESYLGAYLRDNTKRINQRYKDKYGVDRIEKLVYGMVMSDEDYEEIYQWLCEIYKPIGGEMVTFIEGLKSDKKRRVEFIQESLVKGLELFFPVNHPKDTVEIFKDIEATPHRPHRGKITYFANGKKVVTEDEMMIGEVYIMVLEKIADNVSAVASSLLNAFGFPVKPSPATRNMSPISRTPTKTLADIEMRILTSYMGPRESFLLMAAALSPNLHKTIVSEILENSDTPVPDTDIINDPDQYTDIRSLSILNHLFGCAGIRLEKVEEEW